MRHSCLYSKLLFSLIIVLLVCLCLIHFVDPAVDAFFYQHQTHFLLLTEVYISTFGLGLFWIPVFLVCIAIGLIKKYSECFWRGLGWSIASVALASLLMLAIKIMVGRLRPRYWIDHAASGALPTFIPFNPHIGEDCFPSGHTTLSFAMATVLFYCFPKYRWFFFSIAALVALCRVALTAHFPADVVMGAYVGIFSALVLRDKFMLASQK